MNSQDPKRFSALRIALAFLLGFVLLLFAAGAWLFGTESGARAAFSALGSMTGGTVQVDGVHGRLASSVQLDRLRIETEDQQVEMQNLRLDWEPSELLQQRLHIRQLHIEHLSVIQEINEKEPEPAQLPQNIGLPIELRADMVQIDSGTVARGPDELVRIGGAAFSLVFDGERYSFGLDQLALRPAEQPDSAIVELSGQAVLSTDKPYRLDGRFAIAAQTTAQGRSFGTAGHVGLDGSLAEMTVTADSAFQQAQLDAKAVLRPFTEQVLGATGINVRNLDLSSINPEWPRTELALNLSADKDGAGELRLTNSAPGLYNDSKVPLNELQIVFHQEGDGFIFDKISSALGNARQPAGTVNGSGRYADGALRLALRTPELNLQRLDQRLPATSLTGKIDVDQKENLREFAVVFTEPLKKQPLSLSAQGTLTDARLTIGQARLRVGSGEANLSGHVDLAGQQSFAAQGRVNQFTPQQLGDFPQLPRMTLNGRFDVAGTRSPQLAGNLNFRITDSQLAGNPLRGEGQARLRGEQIAVPKLLLAAGENRVTMNGELSERNSELTFKVQAPKLAQLGSGFGGAIVADGSIRGTIARPQISAKWDAGNVRLPGDIRIANTQGNAKIDVDRGKPFFINSAAVDASARGLRSEGQRLASMSARIRFAPRPDAPLALDIEAKGISAGEFSADGFALAADGTTARHTIDARLREPKQNWLLKASGGLLDPAKGLEWQGSVDRMEANGRVTAKLAAPAPITVSQQRVRLDRFRLNADAAVIAIEQFVRDENGITSNGQIERLRVGELLKFAGPSPVVSTDLQLEGEWNVKIADTVNGTASLRRTGGDVVIRGGVPVALGLNALQADIAANKGRIKLELNARGQRLGRIDLDASTDMAGGEGRFSIPSDAPVSGRASIDIPTIAWAGPLISPSIVTEGRLQGDFSAGGTVSDPRLTGRIGGSGLRYYSADLGVDLRNGVLESEFRGSELLVRSLRFQEADGQLTISGPISFEDGKPGARLALNADQFTLLDQTDRRLTIGGQSQITLADGQASVVGDFKVTSGFFDIGREGTPQLSDDVVIVGRTEESEGTLIPAVNIRIGLGDGVKIEGRGIDAVVVGEVRLQSAPGEPLQAVGTLRIAKGTYAAYGRELAIERGALRFTGSIENPALNILAMRRGQEVEAGVSVQGTVLAPRISLVSEPSVPEAEKLSWLVLGRGLSGVGESEIGSLQSAAGALLSQGAAAGVTSQIANAFGLDTVSLSRSDDNLQQRIITLGKQLSSRLYLSYKQGLESANSAVLLRYTLSPSFSVEVEAGARSALSLFYNITFD